LLLFDKSFDSHPRWKLTKELFSQVFGTPRGHPNTKPFIDHVLSFFILDNRVWFRNYQIAEKENEHKKTVPELVEIGPRFVLNPIRIFSGSFGGPTIYQNPDYISPNQLRASMRLEKSSKYINRLSSKKQTKEKRSQIAPHPRDYTDEVFASD